MSKVETCAEGVSAAYTSQEQIWFFPEYQEYALIVRLNKRTCKMIV